MTSTHDIVTELLATPAPLRSWLETLPHDHVVYSSKMCSVSCLLAQFLRSHGFNGVFVGGTTIDVGSCRDILLPQWFCGIDGGLFGNIHYYDGTADEVLIALSQVERKFKFK